MNAGGLLDAAVGVACEPLAIESVHRVVAVPRPPAEAALALVRNRYVSGEIMVVDGGFTQMV